MKIEIGIGILDLIVFLLLHKLTSFKNHKINFRQTPELDEVNKLFEHTP